VLSGTGTACGAGGGGTPGGANTNVQFNNSGVFGGDAGFTYLGNGQATLALGTITTNLKALTITGTWNAVGTVFDAPLFMNITNTTSATGSLLMDLQVGGISQAYVDKNGRLGVNQSGGSFTGGITFLASGVVNNNVKIDADSSGNIYFVNQFAVNSINPQGFGVTSNTGAFGFGWGGNAGASTFDTGLYRQAAGIVEIVNGATKTNPTGLQAYNTIDNVGTTPTNYERIVLDFTTTTNVGTIGTQANGTGTGRPLIIVSAGLYSAAGVPLPTCNAGSKGAQAVVSDATAPTYNATYASGGAVVAHVVCDATNWKTQ
jgi:hypothetical protein